MALWQNVQLGQKIVTKDGEGPRFVDLFVRIGDLPRYKDDQLARDGPNCVAVHDAWRKKSDDILNEVKEVVQ